MQKLRIRHKAIWMGVLFLATSALTACSNEQAYRAIQENRLQDCELQPIPQQANCRAQYEMSYNEYERLRQEASRAD